MNTTAGDTTDTTRRRRAPRQRTTGDLPEPKGYAKARAAFEERAHDWLLARPARIACLPENLNLIAALGVPCRGCGALIYRDGDAGHTVEWKPAPGWSIQGSGPGDRHWATAITASCRRTTR